MGFITARAPTVSIIWTLFCFICITYASQPLIIKRNTGIVVNYGRSIYLKPGKDLHITHTSVDGFCQIFTLRNDILPYTVGALQPSSFACDFGAKIVRYQHFGALSRLSDIVKLQARLDTGNETFVLPFSINVKVMFNRPLETLAVQDLIVNEVGGLSEPISNSILNFKYDNAKHVCQVTMLKPQFGPPYYGLVVNVSSPRIGFTNDPFESANYMDCRDFIDGNLRYLHKEPRSSNRDYVPLVVEVADRVSSNVTQLEFVQVPVRIRRAPDNERPMQSFEAVFSLQADDSVVTPLTPFVLSVVDKETEPDLILVNITQGLQQDEGHLFNTDDPMQPVSAFYQRDIREYKIGYRPPVSKSDKNRVFQLWLEAIDSEGAVSVPFYLFIIVRPANTYAPKVTNNLGLTLYEGQSRGLSADVFDIYSKEDDKDISIEVLGGPNHGILELEGIRINRFTLENLHSGRVRYIHDDSDTSSDNIVFRISDEIHSVDVMFSVFILPKDDSAPVVTHNTLLTVNEDSIAKIDQFKLSAVDTDTDDLNIVFIIDVIPTQGHVMFRSNISPGSEWLPKDGLFEKVTSTFTQTDIVLGRVFYRHEGGNLPIDSFRFRVRDSTDSPNYSNLHTFNIRITMVDNKLPNIILGCPLRMPIMESRLTRIRAEFLCYTDQDSDIMSLNFTLLSEPRFIDTNEIAGTIVSLDKPENSINHFTQRELKHLKIAYKPTLTEIGKNARTVVVNFEVSDTMANTLTGQKFTFELRPVNNQPPIIKFKKFKVDEGKLAFITDNVIDISDKDTPLEDLTLTITKLPEFGTLFVNATSLNLNDIFILNDINRRAVAYRHDGSETNYDELEIMISDRRHRTKGILHIEILPLDDEQPKIKTLTSNLEVPENEAVVINEAVLLSTDADTDDDNIRFIVLRDTSFGRIEKSGVRVDNFKQVELLQGLITFRHTGGEIGTRSVRGILELELSDMSNDTATISLNDKVILNVTIKPVDSKAPLIDVGKSINVEEGGSSVILLSNLNVTDVDTDVHNVDCSITNSPKVGYLEYVLPALGSEMSRKSKIITSFSIFDLQRKGIGYVQNNHKQNEPMEDQFGITCSDGINVSPEKVIRIQIQPVNDESPIVLLREFVVLENDFLPISLAIINALDADTPEDDIMFYISKPPKHGKILYQSFGALQPIRKFSRELLASNAGGLLYQNDGTESDDDMFELVVTDGIHNTTLNVPILVIPVDDEVPRVIRNIGLKIERGARKMVTPKNLIAADVDSDDSSLNFILMSEPRAGSLFIISSKGSYMELKIGMNFTQHYLQTGRVLYVHNPNTDLTLDAIRFDVTDSYNRLINQLFQVSIEPEDTIAPDVISRGVIVPKGNKITLTTDMLSASDVNSDDSRLQYIVTKIPLKGMLLNIDKPGIPITYFTQLDLAASRILYHHTGKDRVKMDSFEFQVHDGSNRIYRTFNIEITDTSNIKPVLYATMVMAIMSEDTHLTPMEIRTSKVDTKSQLTYRVLRHPVSGTLRHAVTGNKIDVFSQKDINNHLIMYRHTDADKAADTFSVEVLIDNELIDFYVFPDSETLKQSVDILIHISKKDKTPPVIDSNNGCISNFDNRNGHQGCTLTKNVLYVSDVDTKPKDIMIFITRYPQHGVVLKNDTLITNFTYQDILDETIRVDINENITVTEDSFEFSLIDAGGNELLNNELIIQWSILFFEKKDYVVKETDNHVALRVERKGHLGATVFVTVSLTDVTATRDEDYKKKGSMQVQFSQGQSVGYFTLKIKDDTQFEGKEVLKLELHDPFHAIVSQNSTALISITDEEDEPSFEIVDRFYSVYENVNEAKVLIRRNGDVNIRKQIICYTEEDSAKGTIGTTVTSFKDYISRNEDSDANVLTFEEGESIGYCLVRIIDDTLYEDDEEFSVLIKSHLGSMINAKKSKTTVSIKSDQKDVPQISFSSSQYECDESIGILKVTIHRSGSDLNFNSSIGVVSRQTRPVSALADHDYIPFMKQVYFLPLETEKLVDVEIIDDIGRPVVEEIKQFELLLTVPVNSIVGLINKATVAIDDTTSDAPSFSFTKTKYTVQESDRSVSIPIRRDGDASFRSSILCYTRQKTAKVVGDFIERSMANSSRIYFSPGERQKNCRITLVDDAIYEKDESFILRILNPLVLDEPLSGLLNSPNQTEIVIKDDDQSIIEFDSVKYYIKEPSLKEISGIVKVIVRRLGDTSKQSMVTLHTKDGSAKSGKDYEPLAKLLDFDVNITKIVVEITVLSNAERNLRKAFSVHIRRDANRIALIQQKKAIVFIEEPRRRGAVTFPLPPQVISLRDYGRGNEPAVNPLMGYPVICVTSCDPHYSRYTETSSICNSEQINNNATKYRWFVSKAGNLQEVSSVLFFTSTNRITLDSAYFASGSRVRCAAQAVSDTNDVGVESQSETVTISLIKGVCVPRRASDIETESFSVQFTYTGNDDTTYPNMMKLRILIPHYDGLIPVVSTRKISNLRMMLSRDVSRIAQHQCSNLLDVGEIPTKYGFIDSNFIKDELLDPSQINQYNHVLRGNNSLRFYKNLDLDACLWTFETYYDMTELLQQCGGMVTTENQIQNALQSHLSIKVPLYISYVYKSMFVGQSWMSYNHESMLRLTFVYDTAMLWRDGVGSLLSNSNMKGDLFPTSIRIQETDRRLIVNFKTKARFRGQFLLNTPDGKIASKVISKKHPHVTMSLALIRSDPTFSEPEQLWRFESDFSIRDYSGTYTIMLIPCIATKDASFGTPLDCNPRSLLEFDVPVRFQQTSDAVEAKFTLNTRFYVMSNKEEWLSTNFNGGNLSDVVFNEGSTIYGRIMIDSTQSLGNAYNVGVQKVYICSGIDGYVPKFEPNKSEYGCLADSNTLKYRFKIIDESDPLSVDRSIGNYEFKSVLASNDFSARKLTNQKGSDGFRLDAKPLFKSSNTESWFLHVVYSVQSEVRKRRMIYSHVQEFTDVDDVHLKHQIVKRQNPVSGIGSNLGTNLQFIPLLSKNKPYNSLDSKIPQKQSTTDTNSYITQHSSGMNSTLLIIIIILIIIIVIGGIIIGAVFVRRRRNSDAQKTITTSRTVSTGSQEGTEI